MAGNKVGHSMRLKGPTTNRVQRHELEPAEVRLVLEPTALQPVAPVPTRPPRSLGDLSQAPATDIVDVVGKHFGGIVCKGQRVSFRRGMRELLAHLEKFDGETWQERWQTAGLNERDNPIGDVAGDDRALRKRLTTAAAQAFAMRLIRPSLFAFRSYKFVRFSTWFRRIADDPLLEEFCARSERLPVGEGRQAKARSQLFAALITVWLSRTLRRARSRAPLPGPSCATWGTSPTRYLAPCEVRSPGAN